MVKDSGHDEGPTDRIRIFSVLDALLGPVCSESERQIREKTNNVLREIKFGNGFYLHIAEKVCGNVADWR